MEEKTKHTHIRTNHNILTKAFFAWLPNGAVFFLAQNQTPESLRRNKQHIHKPSDTKENTTKR